MTGGVFAMVIAAAVLHAVWNALVKSGADKTLSIAAVVMGQGVMALLVLPFVPMLDWSCWPWLVASVGLHVGLIVATVSVTMLGVVLEALELAAIGIIVAGIMSLSLVRQRDGLRNGNAAGLALITGCFIAGYSLVDGLGARIAGTGLGFYAWSSLINTVVYAAGGSALRPGLMREMRGMGRVIAIGGAASFIAYAMVVNAFMQAPIALVTALRETSIVFALLIGVGFLGERLDLPKVVSTMLTLGGAVLLRLSKG